MRAAKYRQKQAKGMEGGGGLPMVRVIFTCHCTQVYCRSHVWPHSQMKAEIRTLTSELKRVQGQFVVD